MSSQLLYCMFEKYKDIHKGEPAYLMGSGPTVRDFFPDGPDGIYVGINEIFLIPSIREKLNYLMTEKQHPDLDALPEDLVVFHCDTVSMSKPNSFRYREYITELNESFEGTNEKILKRMRSSSMIFHGFYLALLLGCNPIHLVGCDCTEDKFHPTEEKYLYRRTIPGWRYIKGHIAENYPHVKIINVNPKKLVDLFPSIYTNLQR